MPLTKHDDWSWVALISVELNHILMPETVEYCLNNLDADIRNALESSPARTRQLCCMDRCGTCYHGPFLVIDGELDQFDSQAAALDCVILNHSDGDTDTTDGESQ